MTPLSEIPMSASSKMAQASIAWRLYSEPPQVEASRNPQFAQPSLEGEILRCLVVLYDLANPLLVLGSVLLEEMEGIGLRRTVGVDLIQ